MKNRLYIPLGTKGGIGKTIAALSLADYIYNTCETYAAVDCDTENDGKAAAFSSKLPTIKLNLRAVADCDRLLDIASQNAVTIADLPANAGGDILPWMDIALVPDVLDALNLEVVGICAVTPEPGAFAAVVEWVERLQDRMKYILVLNHRFSARVPQSLEDTFPEVFRSQTGKAFMTGVKPPVVEIPGLYTGSGMLWANSGLLPSDFANGTAPILDRIRVRSWIMSIHAGWEAALKGLQAEEEGAL